VFHTPAHKVASNLPQAGTIENRPFDFDSRVIINESPDFTVEDHGSVFILQPTTDAASAWIDEHIDPLAMRWGKAGLVVEAFYVRDLVARLEQAGLEVA
jgi:hypothetical protein